MPENASSGRRFRPTEESEANQFTRGAPTLAKRAVRERSRTRSGRAIQLALTCLLAMSGCREAQQIGIAPPERIVLIVIDTLRKDQLSPYSPQAATPHIEALAQRGQVFRDFSAAYHQTTMSMAALFTGRTPSLERGADRERLGWAGQTWCGLWRFREPDEAGPHCIPRSVETLAERLRQRDYWTLGVTSNELLYRPGGYEKGFDQWVEIPGTPVEAGRVNQAVLKNLSERPSDRFFLYVHFMDVHDYQIQGRSYQASVEVADQAVGRLVSILSQLEILDGSVIVLTSDHGEHFPSEKHFVKPGVGHSGRPAYESLTRVPLIVSPSAFLKPSRGLRGVDLHRMILALAEITAEDRSELDPGERFVSERHFQSYTLGSWKSMVHRDTGKHFLVNLQADPDERRSVHRQHPDVVAQHADRISALAKKLGSPSARQHMLSAVDRERLQALGYLDDS
jgi:hypothetical protein